MGSGPQMATFGIVGRGGEDAAGAQVADDVDGKLGANSGLLAVDVGHGQALADRVAVAAGGDEADAAVALPHRLEARGVGVDGVPLERHQLLPGAAAVTLAQGGLAADELALVEGDEAVEAAHAGGEA